MRYVNPRGRNGGLGAAYLYGSSLQNTGAGPFTIAAPATPGPFPQWWGYVGAAAVTLTLPSLATFDANKAFLFAVRNTGTAAASVVVRNPDTSAIVTLAIGEAVLIGWDSALLAYAVVGKWSLAGGLGGTAAIDVIALGATAASLKPAGFRVASASGGYNVVTGDLFVYFTELGGAGGFLTFPAAATVAPGRVLFFKSAAGSGSTTTPIGVTGSTGAINPGDWRTYACNGAAWYEVQDG